MLVIFFAIKVNFCVFLKFFNSLISTPNEDKSSKKKKVSVNLVTPEIIIFLSVNKQEKIEWEDLKHIIISFINDYYSNGNEIVIDKESKSSQNTNLSDIEKKIIKILETKVRPAVAKDGGDIKFKDFKDGVVTVNLQGSCSGCPSSTITLKQGVQNLLCHYIPEIKEVIAI